MRDREREFHFNAQEMWNYPRQKKTCGSCEKAISDDGLDFSNMYVLRTLFKEKKEECG